MTQSPPTDLSFLADLLRRYPVQVVYRGKVLPDRPLKGEQILKERDLALYWEGPRPPSREIREALGLLLRAFREVMTLKERELTLLRAQDEATRPLGILIHEIKNPLMSVLGALELLLEGEDLSEEAKELLQIAEKSAQRIRELLDRSQEYFRLGQGDRKSVV